MAVNGFVAGSVVEVRDEEWIVSSCERAGDGWKIRCVGSSELVREQPATFYSSLDTIEALDPAEPSSSRTIRPTFGGADFGSRRYCVRPPFRCTSGVSRSASACSSTRPDFQRQAVAKALDPARLCQRLLVADAVGLGKPWRSG